MKVSGGFASPKDMYNMVGMVNVMLIVAIVIIIFIVIITLPDAKHISSFLDYGIRQRGDVVFSGTGYDGRSLNDRGDAAAFSAEDKAASSQLIAASTLTGSRDVPVFFQGYDYDAAVKNGSISQAREGITNKEKKHKGEHFTDKFAKHLGQ